MNREKTERPVYEDSIGCTCDSAFADMVATKKRFHKMDGVRGYHLIQSFAEGEVTPELAHLIGQELAEQLLKGRFEAVVTTHLNTAHYHNHIVFNSVSMEDGRKYHSNAKSYYEEIRRISDGLCLKYGLSVIPENGGKGKTYVQWQTERDGRPTWRTTIRMDIRETVRESFTWRQFLAQMEQKGYVWKLYQKYPALKAPGLLREDIRRLDQRIEQMEFLQKRGITTREQLAAFQIPKEEQVVSLLKERRRLYREQPDSSRIGEIRNQLKKLRKEIKMSMQIEKHSREMEERMRQAEQQDQQENSQKPGKEEIGWQK